MNLSKLNHEKIRDVQSAKIQNSPLTIREPEFFNNNDISVDNKDK